nr:unnamed protein product [Digitaria exilis]
MPDRSRNPHDEQASKIFAHLRGDGKLASGSQGREQSPERKQARSMRYRESDAEQRKEEGKEEADRPSVVSASVPDASGQRPCDAHGIKIRNWVTPPSDYG